MLCHCVTPANRQRYTAQLESMFRQRHEVFVEQLGWRELRRTDGRDIDEYDTEESVYLLVMNDHGDVAASGRLNPSWARNQFETKGQLRQRFSHLPPPTGPDVWEGSRLLGGRADLHGKEHARATLGVLLAGGLEYFVRRGLKKMISIFETPALARLQAIGWQTDPLGIPVRYDTDNGFGEGLAVSCKMDMSNLVRTRAAFGLSGSVMYEAAPAWEEAESQAPPYSLLEMAAALRTQRQQAEALRAMRALLSEDSTVGDLERSDQRMRAS